MKRIALLILFVTFGVVAALSMFADAQNPTAHRPYTMTAASLDLGTAAAGALEVAFKSLTIRSDPFNTGYVCVGADATVTCDAAKATAATAGFKLSPGDAVTIQQVGWASSTVYLYNTTANDWVSYIALN